MKQFIIEIGHWNRTKDRFCCQSRIRVDCTPEQIQDCIRRGETTDTGPCQGDREVRREGGRVCIRQGQAMNIRFVDRRIFVGGEIEADRQDSFMLHLCRWSTWTIRLSWDQVKPYKVPVRMSWLVSRARFGQGLPPESLKDILRSQPRAIVMKVFEEWQHWGSSSQGYRQFVDAFADITEKEAIATFKKLRGMDPPIVGYLPPQVLPLFLGEDLGENERRIIESRIKAGR